MDQHWFGRMIGVGYCYVPAVVVERHFCTPDVGEVQRSCTLEAGEELR